MTISEEIIIIANQLANKGLKPSVALIKPKLSQPTPLPLIISTLKSWQHQPDNSTLPIHEINSNSNQENIETNEIEAAVTKAIAPLQAEMAQLKALINQLINKDK